MCNDFAQRPDASLRDSYAPEERAAREREVEEAERTWEEVRAARLPMKRGAAYASLYDGDDLPTLGLDF
ncbi:MAG: hypothetical protein AAF624_00580 [Bacteroidota bacterium]